MIEGAGGRGSDQRDRADDDDGDKRGDQAVFMAVAPDVSFWRRRRRFILISFHGA
jgi:hypothetical protein